MLKKNINGFTNNIYLLIMGCSICGQSGHNCKTCISGDIKSEVNNSCLCNSITKQNYDEGYDNGYDAGVDCLLVNMDEKSSEYIEGFKDGYKSGENSLKKRAHCENNWSEMVFAVKILYPEVITKEDIKDKIDLMINNVKFKCSGGIDNINRYFTDIHKRKEKLVSEYIQNINIDELKLSTIKSVILSGKTIEEFPEICKINISKETGKLFDVKVRKSDLYIIFEDDRIIGISLKADNNCTLTNYSIEKMFNEMNIASPTEMKEIRINILEEYFGKGNSNYTKKQRPEANKLFYGENLYFQEIEQLIIENIDKFTTRLLELVFPNIPYDIYGYNSKNIINLNKLSLKVKNQKVRIERNKGVCGGKQRDTDKNAKIWYSMYFDEKEKYCFEIRFKNDIYGGSSQIQLYKC